MANNFDEKEFEERSDYINEADLALWNVQNDHFDFIQRKLLGVGAKLLVGPRGSGKTHQMKIAHLKCINTPAKPLSIFVSFSKYYHLEPFLTKVPNALQIFHTWVLAKILLGCYCSIEENESDFSIFGADDLLLNKKNLTTFVEKAEKLRASQLHNDPLISVLTIAKVVNSIERFCAYIKKNRAILMLDDAALTLTPEYLVEFFEIVRSVKTQIISPKASVYPGTTQYGPRFHVGHDAEMVYCWLSIDDPAYIPFMGSLIEKRFLQYTEGVNSEVIELFKYASFGAPRTFISLLRNFRSNSEKSTQSKFNSALDQQSKYIETEYLSISQKLSQYRRVIEVGNDFFKKILAEIKNDNYSLSGKKNIIIGISSDSISNYNLSDRMIRFLIEAGLLYEEIPVKHGLQETGEKRLYRRYIPHLLFLIQNRTFTSGHGMNFNDTLRNIQIPSRKQPLRRVLNNLLTVDQLDNLKLDLPQCQSCNAKRLSAEQRFCHNCGNELINQSTFEQCLHISVDELPLTDWQKSRLKEIGLKTVGDFMSLQDPGTTLRRIPHVGQIRSERIYNEVLKTVDEFFA